MSRLLLNYWTDYHAIWCRHTVHALENFGDPYTFMYRQVKRLICPVLWFTTYLLNYCDSDQPQVYFVLISKLNVKINNDDNNDDIYTAHK